MSLSIKAPTAAEVMEDRIPWVDLSDTELICRLAQRGMGQSKARQVVAVRDHPGAIRTITEWLAR